MRQKLFSDSVSANNNHVFTFTMDHNEVMWLCYTIEAKEAHFGLVVAAKRRLLTNHSNIAHLLHDGTQGATGLLAVSTST